MRNFNCHQEVSLHIKKYDESVNDIAISDNYQCLASGKIFSDKKIAGANGQIKILKNNL